uniref:Uncharacterized protein n=1 Tax=Siphoviridae sp. ctEBu1 TaxID=2825393 RepID=A0A8S5QGW6_9CAUD|nr:MAG TPA: hypothetical protein [Siphoviridae sp. ctEBu1]
MVYLSGTQRETDLKRNRSRQYSGSFSFLPLAPPVLIIYDSV